MLVGYTIEPADHHQEGGPMVYPANTIDSHLRIDQVLLGSSPANSFWLLGWLNPVMVSSSSFPLSLSFCLSLSLSLSLSRNRSVLFFISPLLFLNLEKQKINQVNNCVFCHVFKFRKRENLVYSQADRGRQWRKWQGSNPGRERSVQ